MPTYRQVLAALAAFVLVGSLSPAEVTLKIEKSSDLQSWEIVPITPEIVNEHGHLRQEVLGDSGFFRLRIERQQSDPSGLNFVYFMSHQAGSYTEIDDLALEDLDDASVSLTDDFSTRVPERWTFKHVHDAHDEGSPVVTDSSMTRILETLQLECVGYGSNGAGGYNSSSAAMLNTQLPNNFSLSFRAKRNQWAGHFYIIFAPDSEQVMASPALYPDYYAYRLQWYGDPFGETHKFQDDSVIFVRNRHVELTTGTDAWHDFEVRKDGSTVQVFVNGNLVQTDELNLFNYSLID